MEIIAIEGADGVGKTTQADMLQKALLTTGLTVYRGHPLDDTEFGAKVVRHALRERVTMCPATKLALFIAAHIEFFESMEKRLATQPDVLILDRSPISMMVYQRDVVLTPSGMLMTQGATKFFAKPTHIFVLEVPVEVALARTEGEDAFEDDAEFQKGLQDAFRDTVNSLGLPATFVDGAAPMGEVHQTILGEVLDSLNAKKEPKKQDERQDEK